MTDKLKKLFFVSRPVSWLNTAFPFAAGYLVTGGAIDATLVVATLYFLGPYNLMMYGVNDVFDYESDIRNPRKGGIEGMREQRAFHPTILRAVIISNVPFVVWLLLSGSLASALVLVAVVFFVLAYSVPVLRFKERSIIDSVTSSLHFVGPLIYALVLTDSLMSALPFVIAFFLWGMASHAFGAIQDIIPDRKGKLASIATVLGAAWTARFAFILYIVAAGLMFAYGQWVVGLVGVVYALNVASYLYLSDKRSTETNLAWRRFIYLNFFAGFIVTLAIIITWLSQN